MVHVKDSKTGTSGAPIRLTANFFRILSRPQWVLYQYHVDFDPPMEARRLRAALLFQHEETLDSARTFDGALLFLPLRLPNNETVLHSETRNGEKVQITVTLTNAPVCIQFYNIIFRRILKILDMQQIGRNFYNPNDPLNIPQHRLTIWPGYTSTILHCETSIMLCTDVSHKVLRSETVLDFMDNMRQKVGNQRFPERCAKELVGLIVLTKYNNKTYRIDDIAWDHTPYNTFTKGDEDISFKEYYKTQYNLDIFDRNQALLVSHVKKMGPSGGPSGGPPPGPAMLIPELCFLTGLTDEMRADYTIVEDVSPHTKLEPDVREGRLTRFVSNIHKNTDAQAELDEWTLSFDKELLNLTGRVLPAERIFQGPTSYDYNPNSADWSKEMRGLPLIDAPPLYNWVMLYTQRNEREAQSLLQTLNRVAGPLNIRMKRPTMIEYNDHQESLLRALQHNVGPETQMAAKLKTVVIKLAGNVEPSPGTIVDSEVTHPEWYDFYIVSQAVRMGSVPPTHYNVVYDTSGLKPDQMQRLTYKLCHMYYNWQGTIRVPAPCQYAHKLAFLVGQSIHMEPSMKLDDLFYL